MSETRGWIVFKDSRPTFTRVQPEAAAAAPGAHEADNPVDVGPMSQPPGWRLVAGLVVGPDGRWRTEREGGG